MTRIVLPKGLTKGVELDTSGLRISQYFDYDCVIYQYGAKMIHCRPFRVEFKREKIIVKDLRSVYNKKLSKKKTEKNIKYIECAYLKSQKF